MERGAARQERDGFLRLLSLELVFSDRTPPKRFRTSIFSRRWRASRRLSPVQVPRSCRASTPKRSRAPARSEVRRAAPCHRGAEAGTLAIPFVRELTRQVPGEAARCPSRATSQDVIDTAIVLCVNKASQRILGSRGASETRPRASPSAIAIRPWSRARSCSPRRQCRSAGRRRCGCRSLRAYRAFGRAGQDAAVLQFGGAAGTLAAFGAEADAVADTLARSLGLRRPPITWHSGRDLFARLGAEAAILAGAAEDCARRLAPHAGRGRRSVRARSAGARRFLRHAAQAQSGGEPACARGGAACARPRRHAARATCARA